MPRPGGRMGWHIAILYSLFVKQEVSGLTAGAVKG
jgi:hypothetical protein